MPPREPDYVTIDWDDCDFREAMRRIMMLWNRDKHNIEVWYRTSAGGEGYHVWVQVFGKLEPWERFTLRQAWMDDKLRVGVYDDIRTRNPALVDYSHGVLFDMKDGRRSGEWVKWTP